MPDKTWLNWNIRQFFVSRGRFLHVAVRFPQFDMTWCVQFPRLNRRKTVCVPILASLQFVFFFLTKTNWTCNYNYMWLNLGTSAVCVFTQWLLTYDRILWWSMCKTFFGIEIRVCVCVCVCLTFLSFTFYLIVTWQGGRFCVL